MDQGLVSISADEKERITGIFRDIAQAYTNRGKKTGVLDCVY